jgi:aarF domain-containing kinase
MSRSQDILGLIRGIQLVAGASVKTQEAYLKHLWSHSSVRDAIEKSTSQSSGCSKNVITNPGQELQKVGKILQETFARSSVVVEGIRQYSAGGRPSMGSLSNAEVLDDNKPYSPSLKNLDIASITLKELENLLAEHNKMRDVDVKPKKVKKVVEQVKVTKPPPVQEVKFTPPKPIVEPTASIANDEKQVESVMKFITNYDRSVEPTASDLVNSQVPEVSEIMHEKYV